MIPDEAVEAALNVSLRQLGLAGKTLPAGLLEARRTALADILEAAAPHLMAVVVEEFGIFRRGGGWHDAPMENWTFDTRERAEGALRKFIDGESWLEVRSRAATPWKPTDA